MHTVELQRTIGRAVSVSGRGYWSGAEVRVEFRPAPPNSGATFVRSDLGPGARIPARYDLRSECPRRTNLRRGDHHVEMVEHVLAAIAGLQIDNCEVHVDQPEMPGCDGSALAFAEALDRAGIVEQGADPSILEITDTVRLCDGDSWIEARPTSHGKLILEYQLEYPAGSPIGKQSARSELTPMAFRVDIACCRTFLLESEAKYLLKQGLAAHVTPKDLLVFGSTGPIQNELRFSNECARHKMLDVLGDLALIPARIVGEIVAHRTGHKMNVEFAKCLIERFGIADVPANAMLRATA